MVTISFTKNEAQELWTLVDKQYGYELTNEQKELCDKLKSKLDVAWTKSHAEDMRQKTRNNGKYSAAPKCEVCGRGIFDYYSHPDCNSNGYGVVLCEKHADMSMDEIISIARSKR